MYTQTHIERHPPAHINTQMHTERKRCPESTCPCSLLLGLRSVICRMACDRDDCSFMPVVLVDRI